LGLELARDAPNVLRSTRGEPPGIGAWAPLPEARDLVEHHGVVEICGGFDTQVLCRGMERGSSIVQRPGAGREILSPVAERSLVQRTDAQVVRATRRGRGLLRRREGLDILPRERMQDGGRLVAPADLVDHCL